MGVGEQDEEKTERGDTAMRVGDTRRKEIEESNLRRGRGEYQEDTVRNQLGVRVDEETRCASTPNCFEEGKGKFEELGEGERRKSLSKKRRWGSGDDQKDRGKESEESRELKPRVKHTFIDKNMEKYKSNETVRKLVAEFEDRGKESSTNDSGGIYYFGNVAEEQVVCSPLKRRRIFEPVPAPPDGLPRPPSAPWTRLASSSSSPSARPYQWPPTNMSPGARRRRPPSTPTRLRRATPPTASKKFSSSSSERNIGTR